MDQMKCDMARHYLLQLLELDEEPREKLATLQQYAECQILSGQPCTDEITEIISTCHELNLSPKQVQGAAQIHFDSSHLVQSYVMFVCASKMFKTDSSPKEAVDGIRKYEKLQSLLYIVFFHMGFQYTAALTDSILIFTFTSSLSQLSQLLRRVPTTS